MDLIHYRDTLLLERNLLSVVLCDRHCERHIDYINNLKTQISLSSIQSLVWGGLLPYRTKITETHFTDETNEA